MIRPVGIRYADHVILVLSTLTVGMVLHPGDGRVLLLPYE